MKLTSKISFFAVYFWLAITLLFYALVFFQSWPFWAYSLAPIYFVINPLLLKTTAYHFHDDHLVISMLYFHKTIVMYDYLGQIVIKDSSFGHQLLGFPRRMVMVSNGKYDSINILNASPKMLRQLLRVSQNTTLVRTA